jgi:HK97 family phage major capsid protein
MKLTAKLKAYAVAQLGVKADATDAEFKEALFGALGSGKLAQADFAKMLEENTNNAAADIIGKAVADALNPLKDLLANLGKGSANAADDATKAAAKAAADAAAKAAGTDLNDDEKRLKAMLDKLGVKAAGAGGSGSDAGDDTSNPTKVVFKSANGAQSPRVKSVADKYTATKSAVLYPAQKKGGHKHPFAGMPAMYCGEQLMTPSRLGKAVSQAYFKWTLATSCAAHDIPRGLKMTDEDRDLLNFALHEMEWSGVVKTRDDGYDWESKVARRKLSEHEIKSLLDDSTSGGIEIAPIEFDDALVTTPVLFGELFPLVNVVDVSRGRRMKGGAVGNPTFAASTEGSAITAFDTTSFVSAFDTTIYVAAAAMEIGMDFEEDSPTNVGTIIMEKYGEKAQEWLDEQIAIGDGTTEPEGVFTASGTTSVASDMGVGGPATVGDYEGLMFGVPKQYRAAKGSKNVYIANETSYRRARAIPVGPADERRVFGMTHGDFMLLDTPYKIQASIPNSSIAYANLGYYRMYRRLGFNVRMENTGNYLATRNLRLIVCRMRYGGRLELGASCAVQTDAQS